MVWLLVGFIIGIAMIKLQPLYHDAV